jgi:hypothetical protein
MFNSPSLENETACNSPAFGEKYIAIGYTPVGYSPELASPIRVHRS